MFHHTQGYLESILGNILYFLTFIFLEELPPLFPQSIELIFFVDKETRKKVLLLNKLIKQHKKTEICRVGETWMFLQCSRHRENQCWPFSVVAEEANPFILCLSSSVTFWVLVHMLHVSKSTGRILSSYSAVRSQLCWILVDFTDKNDSNQRKESWYKI